MFVVLLMYQKGRERVQEKNLFPEVKTNNLSMRRPTFGIQVKQASTQPALMVQTKKGPKNSLVSPCREGTRKYGYFHMLRLPST